MSSNKLYSEPTPDAESEAGPEQLQQLQPLLIELPPGQYQCCGCGLSQQKPFCDGAHQRLHKQTAASAEDQRQNGPIELNVTDRSGRLWLCRCSRSKSMPYCDGSHNRKA